jgi:hypothetical protein
LLRKLLGSFAAVEEEFDNGDRVQCRKTPHLVGDRTGAKGVPDWGVAEDPRSGAAAQGGPEQKPPLSKKARKAAPPLSWFLAGGISLENIGRALSYRPFGIDVSSGAETEGVKDREKMIALVRRVREDVYE